ncbi:MAG TPA: TAXI family TRAP transporter solute-binding subunit [Syntrophobacteraceae bacterium]|nr:TAXI family TRAP transporter solute-binding subunit [Syntrophobacteraceae bacterium]
MKTILFVIVVITMAALAASAMPVWPAEPNWPPTLTILTASPGGTYHLYGTGLAKILTRALGLPVAERTTEGPNQNIQMIEAGEAQLGFVTVGAALQAWNGTAEWTNGKQYRSIRALFPMYDTPFHFVALKDARIRSISDMAGKRIGVGPNRGTAGTYIPVFLKTLKIDADLSYGTWEELGERLSDGKLDALAAAVGVPFPAIAKLEAKKKIIFVAPSKDEIVALRLAIPELTPSTIPAGIYPSLKKDYATVGLYNFAVASKSLPDDLVYAIVDAVFTNHQELVEAHPAAEDTVPANFVHNTFLPYHPGALRYYGNRMTTGAIKGD